MIEICELSKRFGERCLWQGLKFEVADSEVVAIRGKSGSGKSTLLNCIGGLEEPSSGEVLIDGLSVTRASSRVRRRLRRTKIGFLFQDYALVPEKIVAYNLKLASPKAPVAECESALARVGLGGYTDRVVAALSGGEQQRVALARIVVSPRRVVLADEPTGALDADNEDMVIGMLRSFADEGSCVVISTHSDKVAASADRIIDLDLLARAEVA